MKHSTKPASLPAGLDSVQIGNLTVTRLPKNLEFPINERLETMLVRFHEIGKDKASFEEEIPLVDGALDDATMIAVLRAKGIGGENKIQMEDGGEICMVAFRTIGRWSVSEENLQRLRDNARRKFAAAK